MIHAFAKCQVEKTVLTSIASCSRYRCPASALKSSAATLSSLVARYPCHEYSPEEIKTSKYRALANHLQAFHSFQSITLFFGHFNCKNTSITSSLPTTGQKPSYTEFCTNKNWFASKNPNSANRLVVHLQQAIK